MSRLRSAQSPPIRFQIAMPEPQSHELVLAMEIPAMPERARLLSMDEEVPSSGSP